MTPRPFDLVVGPWGSRYRGRRLPCSIGRGGVRAGKREGDLATPEGIWSLLWLYWRPDRGASPGGCLRALPLGPRLGWSETPEDPAYNCPVRYPHTHPVDRMRRADPLYDICVVTDHNADPTVPAMGSAVFVHLWRRPRWPTAGCVAFRRPDLEWILATWDPRGRMVIRPRGGLF